MADGQSADYLFADARLRSLHCARWRTTVRGRRRAPEPDQTRCRVSSAGYSGLPETCRDSGRQGGPCLKRLAGAARDRPTRLEMVGRRQDTEKVPQATETER